MIIHDNKRDTFTAIPNSNFSTIVTIHTELEIPFLNNIRKRNRMEAKQQHEKYLFPVLLKRKINLT